MGAVPERALSSVAYQVLLALDYLKREKRIVHRDIKPSNLLINSQGVVKVKQNVEKGQKHTAPPTTLRQRACRSPQGD